MVEQVEAVETYDLRHRILGRGRTPADVAADDDADPDSGHFAIKVDGTVVATGTVRRRASPKGQGSAWQIRGMAVEEELRGRGLGSAVLSALVDHVKDRGGGLVWCYVRVAARSLDKRHDFGEGGELFDDPVAGAQVYMFLQVRAGWMCATPP